MRRLLITTLGLVLVMSAGRVGISGPDCANENGDDNADDGIDLSDAIYLLAHLFQGGPSPLAFCFTAGPKEADCADINGDVNADGSLDLSDAVYSLAFSFQGGPAPAERCPDAGGVEVCNDEFDNDGDGDTDCDDADCEDNDLCLPESSCTDGIDNDGDGKTDCADGGDCKYTPPCNGLVSLCDGMAQLDLSDEGFTYAGVNEHGCHEYDFDLPAADNGGGAGGGDIPIDTMRFVLLPAGNFMMGSPENEEGRPTDPSVYSGLDTEALHTVNLSSFLIGKYEVTQGQYRHMFGYSLAKANGLHCVDGTCGGVCQTEYDVSGDGVLDTDERNTARDALAGEELDGICPDLPYEGSRWCELTNAQGGLETRTGLKIPTEAQWEYACRGGKQTKFGPGGGLDLPKVAWTAENSATESADGHLLLVYDVSGDGVVDQTELDERMRNPDALHYEPRQDGQEPHKVGTKLAYGYGLHDTHGNVFEWVLDAYWNGHTYNDTDGATDPPGASGEPPCRSLPIEDPMHCNSGQTCNANACGIYRGNSYLNNLSCFCAGEADYRAAARHSNNPCGPPSQQLGFRAAFYPLP